ncbi:MAG TPA: hypothetical protein PLR25_05355 [Planctomycetaceae bacterium]|nr:hypothetical protein [Planctomycetaceae bacterium]
MAKSPGTGRKKSAKAVAAAAAAAEPIPVSVPVPKSPPSSWFFRPRQLMIAAAIAMTIIMIPVVARKLPVLGDRAEYQVSADQITISAPPPWIPADLAEQVLDRAGIRANQSLLDPTLSERMAAAFYTHPWIQEVRSVRKAFPARIHVDVVYREPAAMVKGVDGYYPIDRKGILLPARDFCDADIDRYPVIERVASVPMGKLGESWGDPAVSGAAELAVTLNAKRDGKDSWWKELELSAILMPRRVALVEDADELEFELRTKGGSEILWGRGPNSRHPGELATAQKLQRLSEYHRDYGGFDDAHGPYQIDIRPWQGIDRSILAREMRETTMR